MFTHFIFFLLLLSLAIAVSYAAAEDEQFRNCSGGSYSCGQVKNLKYPFWGGNRPQFCGNKDFNLTCYKDEYPIIDVDGAPFRIHDVSQTNHTMKLSRFDLRSNLCTALEPRASLFNPGLFQLGSDVKMLFINYDCGIDVIPTEFSKFSCDVEGRKRIGFWANDSKFSVVDGRLRCGWFIDVPVFRVGLDGLFTGSENIQEVLDDGFSVEYNKEYTANCARCEGSRGVCGSGSTGSEFVCLCPEARDQTDPRICDTRATHPVNKLNWRAKLGIGLGAAGFTALVMALGFFIHHRRNRRRYSPPSWVSRSMSSYPSSVRDLEKTGGALFGVQIFCYKELEKATNYFDSERELGDGGYGTVYQGKLKDGRDIAVKRLYEHNYNRVEQFMNEVEILSRLRHQNLVSLYGFTSRHSRELLLVYEYISNGTVADHLHGERASSQPLTWPTRMSIAVETASALVYLHASDIIHRDVKTNNILLDDNNKVKVADFGLSRLLPNDVTHVSTAPQGTPGYVDPDYHESYQLTDKSDVYSFGVVLVELISSKPAVDMSRHRHEINLSNMAINKIQNNEVDELVDPSLGYGSDDKVRNMISCVAELAFRCLQSGKDMRPSMLEVLENLQIIQSDDSDVKNGDLRKETDVLPTLSPDSVTTPWISKGTTPNTSS